LNLGAHIAVVDRAFPSPGGADRARVDGDDRGATLLGSALPDLATIGRFRLLGSTDHTALADGIALHHLTDDVFHRHPWFTARNRELTAALTERGVARGPAMACSHVGIELLLDGRLTVEGQIRAAYDDAFAAVAPLRERLVPLVPTARQDEWSVFLHRLTGRSAPPDYVDPHAVATRLHHILARRPRLALPDHQIDLVAHELADRRASVAETALDLVADIAATIAATHRPTPR